MSKPRPSLFERLRTGLDEGIRFAQQKISLQTTQVPQRPPTLAASELINLRQQMSMSQGVFARVLNVSAKTVQSWEQGDRTPSQAALRLLQILAAQPELVCQIVGLRVG